VYFQVTIILFKGMLNTAVVHTSIVLKTLKKYDDACVRSLLIALNSKGNII